MKKLILFVLFSLLTVPVRSEILYTKEFHRARIHIVTTLSGSLREALGSLGYALIAVGVENRGSRKLTFSNRDLWDFYRYQRPYDRLTLKLPEVVKPLFATPALKRVRARIFKKMVVRPGQRDYLFLLLPDVIGPGKISGIRYHNAVLGEEVEFGLFQLPNEWKIKVKKKIEKKKKRVIKKFNLPKIVKQPVDSYLTFEKIFSDFSTISKLSPIAKGEKWKTMVGKGVQWTGIIRSQSNFNGYRRYKLDVGMMKPGSFDTEVVFEDPDYEGPVDIGKTLTFTGYLWDFKPAKPFIVYVTRAVALN